MSDIVIVTRHPALVEYLRELGKVKGDVKVISHVSDPKQIEGKHVIGVLPLHLAALAAKVTVIPLIVPPEKRGKELTLEEVYEYAGAPRTFEVREVW